MQEDRHLLCCKVGLKASDHCHSAVRNQTQAPCMLLSKINFEVLLRREILLPPVAVQSQMIPQGETTEPQETKSVEERPVKLELF